MLLEDRQSCKLDKVRNCFASPLHVSILNKHNMHMRTHTNLCTNSHSCTLARTHTLHTHHTAYTHAYACTRACMLTHARMHRNPYLRMHINSLTLTLLVISFHLFLKNVKSQNLKNLKCICKVICTQMVIK